MVKTMLELSGVCRLQMSRFRLSWDSKSYRSSAQISRLTTTPTWGRYANRTSGCTAAASTDIRRSLITEMHAQVTELAAVARRTRRVASLRRT